MTLLEEAKLKYPIGTKFKSPQSGIIFTIETVCKWTESSDHKEVRCRINNNEYHPYLYYNNKWAEIISSPVLQVINQYEIY